MAARCRLSPSPRRAAPSALALLLFLLPGAGHTATPEQLARGREIYQQNCAGCHGARGRGDGPKSAKVSPKPRDLSRAAFKCRCTPSGDLPTDQDLARVVARGLPGTPMLNHDDVLSADDIAAVVAHVKTLAPRFAGAAAPDCLALPEPPPASAAAIAEGRQMYRLLGCWQCHGAGGAGDGPAADGLKDDFGQKARPGRFSVTGQFKCGGDERDLYRTLHTGINGSPMPSYAEAFLYPREAGADLKAIARAFDEAAAAEVRAYLEGEADRAAIAALSEAERGALAVKRTWSLVRYLRSLIQPEAAGE